MPNAPRRLPITGSAHKTANGGAPISCRNRHCPKCQAAASRRWLADREAELLPVPYFHLVYTLPSELRDVAYQNKGVVYDLLWDKAGIKSQPKPTDSVHRRTEENCFRAERVHHF